ncbi:MAG: hypothetical protein Ct9H300mP28_02920 [Pseudomonadota bacterium]|nr:MAG: hypothetical protein Ct9H300mP28_02920 [Pseudomonadota bacterium]
MQNRIDPDPEVSKLIEEAYLPHDSELSKVIGSSEVLMHRRDFWQSTFGNLITDAMREIQKTDVVFFSSLAFWSLGIAGKDNQGGYI